MGAHMMLRAVPATALPARSASWLHHGLAPGRYELVCNLRHHYADGMHQLFTVC
jgi:uncharacterized cupredoxin-like copper-binding protein